MKKILLIVWMDVMINSCTTAPPDQERRSIQEEVIEMNWNCAVKDLYLVDLEGVEYAEKR